MIISESGSQKPSRYMPSTSSWCPIRWPQRARGSRYGVFDMLSVPPARITRASPQARVRAADSTACRPDPHA